MKHVSSYVTGFLAKLASIYPEANSDTYLRGLMEKVAGAWDFSGMPDTQNSITQPGPLQTQQPQQQAAPTPEGPGFMSRAGGLLADMGTYYGGRALGLAGQALNTRPGRFLQDAAATALPGYQGAKDITKGWKQRFNKTPGQAAMDNLNNIRQSRIPKGTAKPPPLPGSTSNWSRGLRGAGGIVSGAFEGLGTSSELKNMGVSDTKSNLIGLGTGALAGVSSYRDPLGQISGDYLGNELGDIFGAYTSGDPNNRKANIIGRGIGNAVNMVNVTPIGKGIQNLAAGGYATGKLLNKSDTVRNSAQESLNIMRGLFGGERQMTDAEEQAGMDRNKWEAQHADYAAKREAAVKARIAENNKPMQIKYIKANPLAQHSSGVDKYIPADQPT